MNRPPADASDRCRFRIVVVGQVPPPVHGSTVMTVELLAAFERLGVDAVLVDKKLSREIDEVGEFGLSKLLRGAAFTWRVLGAGIRERRGTLCVYFLSCSAGAFLVDAVALGILRLCGLRSVPYLHGIGFRSLASRSRVFGFLLGRVFGAAAAVVAPGRPCAEDVASWVEPERVHLVPNTVPDLDLAVAAPARPRTAAAEVRCLYFSTLDPAKGVWEFLEVAREVVSLLPEARFKVAGQSIDPAIDRDLQAFIVRHRLTENVRLLGPVYGADRDALFHGADLFVFPSSHENQPLVLLDAMKHALPVVATRVGCIPDQVIDGRTGYLVQLADRSALIERTLALFEDARLRLRMGAEARRLYETRYSPEVFDRRWQDTITAVDRDRP